MTTERVTYRPEGERARTIYLQGVKPLRFFGEECISGDEVNREGESIIRAGDRTHVIQTALIVRRVPVVMNNTYGEFEEAR